MAAGYLGGDCVQAEIDAAVNNGIDAARARLTGGVSATVCDDCDEPIPKARQMAVKGCRYCVGCQAAHDTKQAAMYNRRGSKDSQLR